MNNKPKSSIFHNIKKHWQLYLLAFFPTSLIMVFSYLPMGGVVIAFKEFSIRSGIFGGEWVGLKYFNQLLFTPLFPLLLKNTLILSLYSLIAGFPIPVILAIAISEIRSKTLKKIPQMITYAPYFISTVVMVGMLLQILHLRIGLVNNIIDILGGERQDFMGKVSLFRHLYVWSGVWQGAGFSAIIYIAALSAVEIDLVEASIIDGANLFKRIIHVDLPAILPTIVIMMILSIGNIMSIGFDKAFLMQNPVNLPVSEIISTFVYKRGLVNLQYSYATAVGLFNSAVNFVLLISANTIAKKLQQYSLW